MQRNLLRVGVASVAALVIAGAAWKLAAPRARPTAIANAPVAAQRDAGAATVAKAPVAPHKHVAVVRGPRPPRGKFLALAFEGNGQGEIEPCG